MSRRRRRSPSRRSPWPPPSPNTPLLPPRTAVGAATGWHPSGNQGFQMATDSKIGSPPFFLDCGGLEGGGRNERRDQILQLSVPEPQSFKPEGPNAYSFKFCHLATLPSGGPAVQETSDTQRVGQRALCSLGQLLCFRLGLPASQLTGPAAVASS